MRNTRLHLGVDIDGHATNVDEAVELGVGAANGLSIALGTVTGADHGNGAALGTDLTSDTGKELTQANFLEGGLIVRCLLDLLAALNGTGVALVAYAEGASESESGKGGNSEDTGEHVENCKESGW